MRMIGLGESCAFDRVSSALMQDRRSIGRTETG